MAELVTSNSTDVLAKGKKWVREGKGEEKEGRKKESRSVLEALMDFKTLLVCDDTPPGQYPGQL